MPSTLAELLLARVDDPNPGYLFEGDSIPWGEVVERCVVRAGALSELLDSTRPPHFGLLLENVPEYLLWVGAAALSGATAVGLNPTRRGAELAMDATHADCQFVVTGEPYASLLPADVATLDVESLDYDRLLARQVAKPFDGPLPDAETTAVLIFTSGSTSAPKAVRLTNGRAGAAGERMAAGFGLSADDVAYCQMPLFHGNALLACWAAALAGGSAVVLRRRFSASEFIDDVRKYGCTYFTYVGRSVQYVLAQPERDDDVHNTLRVGFGTEASVVDRAAFEQRFGCALVESYGSSESAIVLVRTPDTPPSALGVPRPGDDADIAVVDADGNECPVGQVGELVNRAGGGPFEGYYNNSEASEHRLRHGWFWSGDLAWRDANGYFHFAGRSDDRIRVDGENLSAAPIESLLERLPGVAAAAVYAVADPSSGDLVMAALEMEHGETFDPGAFHASLMAQPDLGTKWPPSYVRIVEGLPMTANTKVQISVLRSAGLDTTDPIWRSVHRGGAYEPSESIA